MGGIDIVRAAAATVIGVAITEAHGLSGGHTGQVVDRLRLADGRSVVLKAAKRWRSSGETWEFSLRTEIQLYTKVPQLALWRPAHLATVETEQWLALVMEDLDKPGRRMAPWSPVDAESIAVGLAAAHRETFGGVQPPGVIAYDERDHWQRVVDEGEHSPEWRRWARAVANRASAAIAMSATRHLTRCVTHGDIYANNIFLVGGQLYLVDWAQVGWTSRSRDAVRWALTAETWSDIKAASAFETYERHAGPQPVEERRATLAAATGFMLLRLGQEARGTVMRRHLARRLDPASQWLARELGAPAPPRIAEAVRGGAS